MADDRLKDRISGYIEELIELEQKAGDPITVANLKRELPHIRQGLVRFMVIGQTSAGKSALINSLMSKIIVPENKAVSSPIPVWIGYHSEEAAEILIYNKSGEVEPAGDVSGSDDVLKFIKNFCYRIGDRDSADGQTRERYDQVDYGSILIRSELLRDDVTIIDTPGISASTVDNAKTIKALEDGVDFVIFLTKNSQLNADEVDFLHRYIIGDYDDHIVAHPIPARNIIFVNNPHGIFSTQEDVFINTEPVHGGKACGVKPLLKSIGSEKNGITALSEEEIERIVRDNIIFINAKEARVGRHGAYDYRKYAPDGCTEEELEGMTRLADSEKKYSSRFDTEELVESSKIENLEKTIKLKAYAAKSAVINTRISEWHDMLLAVREAAVRKITAVNMDLSEILDQKQKFKQLKDLDDNMTQMISDRFIDFQDEYTEAFRSFIIQYQDMVRSECFGATRGIPDGFGVGLKAFHNMTPEQRVAYIEPFIINYTDNCISACNASIKKLLEETRGSTNGTKAPFEVLEDVRAYVQDQSMNLKTQINTLKGNGAEKLGVAFPTDLNISKVYDELRASLVDAVYTNIANQFNSCRNEIINSIHPRVQKIPINIWNLLFHRNDPQYCWDIVRDKICQDVVIDFFDRSVALAEKQTETKKAFGAVSSRVQKTHHEVFAAVNQSLYTLELESSKREERRRIVAEENNKIIAACKDIEEKLNSEIVILERGS